MTCMWSGNLFNDGRAEVVALPTPRLEIYPVCVICIYTYIIVQVRECCKGENRSVWFVLL